MATRAHKVDWRLQAQRLQDVDLQQPDCRCVRGLGQGGERRRPGRPDSRLCAGQGHEGPERPRHPRQGGPARQHHRRDRDGRRVLPRRKRLPRSARPQGPVHLPEQRALRHRLGRAGRGRRLLASRPPVHAGPQAVWPPPGRQPADPEEAGRHADRDCAGPAGLPAPGPHEGRGHGRGGRSPPSSSATAAASRWTLPAWRAT